MTNLLDDQQLATRLAATALLAGDVIMHVYDTDFDVTIKRDHSPVTQADQAAEALILAALAKIAPNTPVISEEAASEGHIPDISAPGEEQEPEFFLVDPLDGTKEFVSRNGEFTVNIGLVRGQTPVLGVIYAPTLGQLYYTPEPGKAVKIQLSPEQMSPEGSEEDKLKILAQTRQQSQPLSVRKPPEEGMIAVTSRSHSNDYTKSYLKQFPIIDSITSGSSLKLCLIAEGKADIYPRLGRTMEWDTAAGHALLLAAGGQARSEQGVPLIYGKTAGVFGKRAGDCLANPGFIARGKV